MASSVQLRPNYYDILGIAPSATQDEICRAFTKLMGLFSSRPTVATAQLSVAFETLRNPAKRRGYDQMLGFASAPKPAVPALAGSGRASLLGSAWTNLAEQVTGDRNSVLPKHPEGASESPEPRVATFIASSLRVPAGAIDTAPLADSPAPPPESPRPAPKAEVPVDLLPEPFHFQPSEPVEDTFDWRRVSLIGGGLLAAAGLVGTFAGLSVRDNEQPATLQASVSTPVPPARPVGDVGQVPASATAAVAQRVEPPAAARIGAPPAPKRAQPASEPAADTQVASTAPTTSAEASPADAAAADELAPQPAAAPDATAQMPLPKSVVAQTIGRIGYPCGSVVSTSAVDGAPGVFSISCSSGQTYRATPINGRYHFRRSAG